eukprot:CAMPEP_0183340500 /NCGR_PEP_ID=MMETSP0164_2-20130417/7035_1 /TAXON_ID=221442 /ORGANISM="Coccolithus pelagicus ssp braarudi, Strain PLY182g" /LENGTH=101 /DNA_ID=CAMNT_0025510651 /DNA_START=124 /DNA_END=429 /DNA_ORIENTATION=+
MPCHTRVYIVRRRATSTTEATLHVLVQCGQDGLSVAGTSAVCKSMQIAHDILPDWTQAILDVENAFATIGRYPIAEILLDINSSLYVQPVIGHNRAHVFRQ